jgi:hypothetical protein
MCRRRGGQYTETMIITVIITNIIVITTIIMNTSPS